MVKSPQQTVNKTISTGSNLCLILRPTAAPIIRFISAPVPRYKNSISSKQLPHQLKAGLQIADSVRVALQLVHLPEASQLQSLAHIGNQLSYWGKLQVALERLRCCRIPLRFFSRTKIDLFPPSKIAIGQTRNPSLAWCHAIFFRSSGFRSFG